MAGDVRKRKTVIMRRFTGSDIAAAREIDRLTFPAGDQYAPEFYEHVAASEDFDAIVATDSDDKVVGWALLDLRRRPMRIRSVSVHPECRRRGFGTALVTGLLCRHSTQTDLLVEPANREAIALYQRLHFRAADVDPEMPLRQRMVWEPDKPIQRG